MSKAPKRLTPRLTTHLLAYAAGAIAASPSLTHAEVIYTPIDREVHSSFILDLNHDGIDDFQIFSSDYSDQGEVKVLPAEGNRIFAAGTVSCAFRPTFAAAALPVKTVIGPGKPFQSAANCMAAYNSYLGDGPWLEIKNRYLGLVFIINGEEHFGWARLNLGRFYFNKTATITGYAYESTPNKPIRAGDEGNFPEISAPSGTLGELALGAMSPTKGKN